MRVEQLRLSRIGVAGAVSGNVMLIAVALYSGTLQGMAREYRQLFQISSLLLSVPALTYCAAEFYRGAWAALRTRTPHMDLPVSLGILVGAGYGLVSVLRGHGEIYFDTVTMLVFLLLVGRYLELVQQNKAREAAERAQMLTPGRARRVSTTGSVEEVFIEEVRAGDTVQVRIGDTIPVDGVVTLGLSDVDNRLLTGESGPVTVGPAATVYAGATNLTAVLHVRSTCSGVQTRIARLMREVERSRQRRAPVVRLADRVAGRFTLMVLVLALVTLCLWWPRDPGLAVEHVIALLIEACPCALAHDSAQHGSIVCIQSGGHRARHGGSGQSVARGSAHAPELTDRGDERVPLTSVREVPMSALFVVLPLALLVSSLAVVAFVFSVKRGEFDDLETPARRILVDDEPSRSELRHDE